MQEQNRVIPITIMNAIQNKKFNCSSGNQIRDFIYIDDLINVLLKILKNKKLDGEIVNIGSGETISIKKLILKICKLSNGGQPQFGKIPLRKDEIIKLFPFLSKVKKSISWSAKVSLDQGLKKTIQYFKKEHKKFKMNSENILSKFFKYGVIFFPLLLLVGPLVSELFLISIIIFFLFQIIKEKNFIFYKNNF